MTHFSKCSRTTSDTLRPSASALLRAASQSSSGMRMLRSAVPLGIRGADQSALEPAGGKRCVPADVVAACCGVLDGAEVPGLDVFDALADGEGAEEFGGYGVAHTSSVPTRVPTRKGES